MDTDDNTKRLTKEEAELLRAAIEDVEREEAAEALGDEK